MKEGANRVTNRVKQRAYDSLNKIYWTIGVVLAVLAVLAAVLWWYDGYWLKPS